MIRLIVLENDEPVFNPEVRTIVQFRKIIEKDKGSKGDHDGRKKLVATMELAFLFWYCDPRSDLKDRYPKGKEKDREFKARIRVGLPNEWKIDKYVQEAIDYYESELSEDFDIQFLESNISSATKTKEWLDDVDYSLKDGKGKPIYDPIVVSKINKDAGGVLDSLHRLREKAFKSKKLDSNLRGGGEKGDYED